MTENMEIILLYTFPIHHYHHPLHPQNPKNLLKPPINPPINLQDLYQIEGNDPAERILSSSSSEVDERLLGSGRGGI
jgi:hypothetical protein